MTDASHGHTPEQLPSGRHGLSREHVVANQKKRIVEAVALVSARDGYTAMSIDAITATSGVSRRTFYDLYGGKEEAFLAACEYVTAGLERAIVRSYVQGDSFAVRCGRCLQGAVDFLLAHPDFARMGMVEVLAAGPAAVHRRDLALQMIAALIDDSVATMVGGDGVAPPTASEAVVGGVYAVIFRRLIHGRLDEVPALVPDLLFSILLPFLGRDAAREAQVSFAGRSRSRAESRMYTGP